MKNPYDDPDTTKTYENEYVVKIKSFAESKQHSFFDDEVIEYA